jgi:hypothetical protein
MCLRLGCLALVTCFLFGLICSCFVDPRVDFGGLKSVYKCVLFYWKC